MNSSDYILTGLQRSGTTLACSLLNKLPNSVALHEPMNPGELRDATAEEIMVAVAAFFASQRHAILRDGYAQSKSTRGAVPTNNLSDEVINGKRGTVLDGDKIVVRNVDKPSFKLCIKHPAFFSAVLPTLVEHFECFAVVRNPLAVLLSWRAAGMPVTQGRMSRNRRPCSVHHQQ